MRRWGLATPVIAMGTGRPVNSSVGDWVGPACLQSLVLTSACLRGPGLITSQLRACSASAPMGIAPFPGVFGMLRAWPEEGLSQGP